MGDTDDGSSSAAHSAQDPDGRRQRGFLGRIIGALSPSDDDEVQENTQERSGNGANSVPFLPGMVNLRRMRLEDVAVPKADIVSVPTSIKKDDLVKVFRDSGLTRLPVYSGTLDSPIGMIHLKDLALKHGFNGKGLRYNLRKMVRPLLFAPPSMPIGVMLQKMQSERIHMALVIDEYGGVDGLATIEDLIEQVIGEIEDEHDIVEGQSWIMEKPGCYLVQAKTPVDEFETEIGMRLANSDDDEEIVRESEHTFLVDGAANIREMNRVMNCSLPTDGPKTLNGLVLEYLETIPDSGTGLKIEGYPIEIIETKENKVQLARIYVSEDRRQGISG